MPYNHNDEHEHDRHEQFEQDWFCFRCEGLLSPDRPPVLNLANCSCTQAGAPINDPSPAAHIHALAMNMNELHIADHAPISYPTSNDGSVKTPDGPEARDPANKYLPLGPAIGLGEAQALRRASFDAVENQLSLSLSRSYCLNRYLDTLLPHERSLLGSWDNSNGGWLRQNTYLVGPSESVQATGRGSGSGSGLMSSGYSTGSSGPRSSNIDHVAGSGGWMAASQAQRDDWPMEIDDDAIGDDDYMD